MPTFLIQYKDKALLMNSFAYADYAEAIMALIHNVWLRGFDAKTVAEVFELPENIIPVMMFAMGYPNEKAKPNAWHFRRMPIEDFVTEL